jgi:leader peptidase (prepilin peptidase)/N-methyltransferase
VLYATHGYAYFFAYAVFFSALIVTVRTDLEHMLISRLATIGVIPIAWILSLLGLLPISLSTSLLGSFIGYGSLWLVAYLFYALTKKHGLGEGDFDLLALIGAFCGPQGVFIALLVGSWIGTLVSLIYIIASKKNLQVKIPFGPFLALGAMCYVLWHNTIEHIIFSLI